MRVTALLGAAALAMLTGCTAGSASPSTAPAPPVVTGTDVGTATEPTPAPPSPTLDPTEAEILRVYAEFMDARNVSLNDPRKAPDRRLFEVSVPPARDELYQLVLYYRSKRMAIRGHEVSAPMSVHAQNGTATVVDCLDGSGAVPILVKTGKSAIAPNQPPRLLVTSTLVQQQQSWVVKKWNLERSQPC